MPELVVIGAATLDRPIRLSGPPQPGGRLSGMSLEPRLGGGGANAAVALRLAGHAVALAAVVAADADGDAVVQRAVAAGLDLGPTVRRAGPSRTTLILLDPAGERLVLGLDSLAEPLPALPAPDRRPHGVFVRAPYPGAAAWAAASSGPVLAHWGGSYPGPADVVVGSADDLDDASLADPFAAGRARLGERLAWVVVTRGGDGAAAYGSGGEVAVRAPAATVRDATGAGDIFAAGLLDALVAGAQMPRALEHACAWGAAAVSLECSAPVGAPAGTFRAF